MIFVKLLLLRHQKLPPKIASQNLKKPLYFFIKNSVFVLILLIVHIMDQKKSHFPMICNNLLKKGITILHWIMYIPRVYTYKNSTLKIFFTHPHRQCFSWWERKIATIADKKKNSAFSYIQMLRIFPIYYGNSMGRFFYFLALTRRICEGNI